MTHTTSNTIKPATLTEQELFAAFITLTVTSKTNFGTTSTSESYEPESYLHVWGEWGELVDAGQVIVDHIVDADEPEDYLHSLASCMENYAKDLRRVMTDFRNFKSLHSTEGDLGEEPEDQNSKEYADWVAAWDEHEANPRFRSPASVAEGSAA